VLRVGLTGGIAAGKSTVTGWLAELGAMVVDADRIARAVVEPGTEGLQALTRVFGDEVLTPDGRLDRAGLARIVFADASARRRLEEITHPLIARRTRELIDAAEPGRIVVHDVPLLVEKQMGDAYHLVVVVHAEAQERVSRLVRYRGLTEEEAWARVEAQADDEARRASADVGLDTGAGLEALKARTAQLWRDRLLPFDANLRRRRQAPRGPVDIVPHDPRWPDDAQRLIARIRRATGGPDGQTRARIEHIGSTAVPGLPAKDVIDLMIGVPDLATADAMRPGLEGAGFVVVEGLTRDTPHAALDGDATRWTKRFHASCDPGRAVNVHLREVGGPGWRLALLMRDWMRADPTARAEYAELKLALAGRGLDAGDYAEAKEPWIASAVPRALAWQEFMAESRGQE
jgi:dephospho-CoA kinase